MDKEEDLFFLRERGGEGGEGGWLDDHQFFSNSLFFPRNINLN